MNLYLKVVAILGMVALISCTAYTQTSNNHSSSVVIRDQDVIDVFSSKVAVVRHQGEKCLYDIRNGVIVERNIDDVWYDNGYILARRLVKRYTLYSRELEVVRTWQSDSSRLLSDGAVAIKTKELWSVIALDGKTSYTSKQAIIRWSSPYVVLDSSRVLVNTVTGSMLMDSAMLFFRWGKGVIVGRDTNGTTTYFWYSSDDNRRLDIGNELEWITHNSIVFSDSSRRNIVYDTNMTVLCQSPNRVMECGKFVRVEYSRSGETWCFIDLIGSDTRCGYDGVWPNGEGVYLVRKESKWGMLRYDGKVIIPVTHEILVGDGYDSISKGSSYNGKNVIKYYTSLTNVSYYYYDINGYSKLFAE